MIKFNSMKVRNFARICVDSSRTLPNVCGANSKFRGYREEKSPKRHIVDIHKIITHNFSESYDVIFFTGISLNPSQSPAILYAVTDKQVIH